jgi:hypothetical protein
MTFLVAGTIASSTESEQETQDDTLGTECSGGGSVALVLSPTPSPGNDAPCAGFSADAASEQDCTHPDGALTLEEDADGCWIPGGGLCNGDKLDDQWAELSRPMTVD